MEDYPRTLADFERRFRSEEACRDYLFRVRWPEGFRCPRCGESRGWRLRSALWQCARCAYQASLDCGDDFPGHAHSSEGVVPRSVVDDQPEEWRQRPRSARSEEHTSELQSRFDLVCRLLLEKKKQNKQKAK